MLLYSSHATLLYSTLYSALLNSTRLDSIRLHSTLLYSTLLYSTPLNSTQRDSTLHILTQHNSILLYFTMLNLALPLSILHNTTRSDFRLHYSGSKTLLNSTWLVSTQLSREKKLALYIFCLIICKVEVSTSALDPTCSFVLDAGLKIFIWAGERVRTCTV